jgi:2',3'-cyclic-nucleotide 2'-phosphodiesterase (5'-nucleotidase family)
MRETFYSGSILHALAVQSHIPYFPEYEFFNAMAYDAVTLGNHEFDAGDSGLNIMLKKVASVGSSVPIVASNLKGTHKHIKKSVLLKLENADGEKLLVGILGALAPDGCSVSRGNRSKSQFIGYNDLDASQEWSQLYELLSSQVQSLREQGAKVIVLLLHGGGDEDSKLAENISDLDIVISGHTHELYFKKVGKTFISQAGSRGRFLGNLMFNYDFLTDSLTEVSHKEIVIDGRFQKDLKVEENIKIYSRAAERLLSRHGERKFSFSEVIFKSEGSLEKDLGLGSELGREVTTGIAKSLKRKVEDFRVYFTSMGLVRTGIEGSREYRIKDIFNILPIGFHGLLMPGASTVSFYVTFKELKRLIQFLEIYSRFRPKFTPAFSSDLSFSVNPYGIPLINRINDIKVVGYRELVDDQLIHVGTNSFVFQYIDFIIKKSHGLVNIVPKSKDGKPMKKPFQYGPEYLEFAESKKM